MSESSSFFGDPDPIFANKDLLRVQHLPDKDRIIGRDEELTQLANAIKDAAHGRTPNNVLVYGKTGTGKSLCTKYITNDLVLSAETNDVSVGVAYVDCFQDSTETQTVRSIADSLNDPTETDVKIPMSGLSTSDYYRRLWNILETRYDVGLIILDEIDKLDSDDVLMQLSRAAESGKIEDSTLGIIGISNKIRYKETLNERVRSSLSERNLVFAPYDANQLGEILNSRIDAFRDGVVEDAVIPKIAALAACEHGDARKAIDILRHAGEVAYEAGAEQVMEEHVRQAQQHAEKDRFRELVNGAPTQAKAALLALTELSVNSNDDAFLTSRVYDQYERICNHLDMDILSVRRFRDILKEQGFLGVVEIEKINKGSAGGIHLQNRLIEDPQVVRETILEDSRMQDWTRE